MPKHLLAVPPLAVSVRHFGGDEGERQRLREQCGDSVSIAGEDGYLSVEEGRLRVSSKQAKSLFSATWEYKWLLIWGEDCHPTVEEGRLRVSTSMFSRLYGLRQFLLWATGPAHSGAQPALGWPLHVPPAPV